MPTEVTSSTPSSSSLWEARIQELAAIDTLDDMTAIYSIMIIMQHLQRQLDKQHSKELAKSKELEIQKLCSTYKDWKILTCAVAGAALQVTAATGLFAPEAFRRWAPGFMNLSHCRDGESLANMMHKALTGYAAVPQTAEKLLELRQQGKRTTGQFEVEKLKEQKSQVEQSRQEAGNSKSKHEQALEAAVRKEENARSELMRSSRG